jgi:putative transposase
MRANGIAGARRGKRVRTTKPDPAAARHPDLVRRDFTANGPNQLWVTDLTFVPTWAGNTAKPPQLTAKDQQR